MTERKDEYHFYKSLKICVRCHKEQAEPNRVMCWKCQDKEKEYSKTKRAKYRNTLKAKDREQYQKLKSEGICVHCKHEKAVQGKTKCTKCLWKIKNKRDSQKCDIQRSERTSYGLCYICGKNRLIKDKKVCAQCYEKRVKSISKIMYMPVSKEWRAENDLLFAKRQERSS